jgi:signal transduction histidine kinase/CheY-like chemotaxis protein
VEYFERALAGESTTWIGTVGEATFECRLTPVRDAAGQVTGVIGVAIDVTERKQAEDVRLALERQLLEAHKLESLGVLAGGVAHDFNNLLVGVLGNVSLALDELPAGSPVRVRLERIEAAARRGSDLTRQMLAYAGKGSVALEPVDLNAVVEETDDLVHASLGSRVTLGCELARDLPAVEADRTQIVQVLMNLVINASEAMGDQEGVVTVRTGSTCLTEADLSTLRHAPDAAPGPHVWLEVTDTGCGLDADTLAKIFDPFFSTKFTGRGLGLATVLGVVRAHRGALGVESAPGRGTTIRVYLPSAELPARTEPQPAPAAAEAAPEGRIVLLVDDEADVRAVTAHMLERIGCHVLEAGDGREGIEVFRTNARLIDAVILDLTLPRMGGEGALREIRSIRPDARVILMSGYDDEQTMRRLVEAGSSGFLRKPFSVADLRSMMGKALE